MKKNNKILLAAFLISFALVGCKAVDHAAGTMILGRDFIKAAEGFDTCDNFGVPYLIKASKSADKLTKSSALIALGAYYAAGNDMTNVNKIASQLHELTPDKSLVSIKSEIIASGKKQVKTRLSNGVVGTCM